MFSPVRHGVMDLTPALPAREESAGHARAAELIELHLQQLHAFVFRRLLLLRSRHNVQVLSVPADVLETIVLAVVVIPEGLVLELEADAELDPILRWDAGGQLQDERKGVGVLAAVDVVHEGALDVGEAGPRVEGGTQLHRLLEPNVPDFDGAGQRTLLQ